MSTPPGPEPDPTDPADPPALLRRNWRRQRPVPAPDIEPAPAGTASQLHMPCRACGCVVVDGGAHALFHDQLAELAAAVTELRRRARLGL